MEENLKSVLEKQIKLIKNKQSERLKKYYKNELQEQENIDKTKIFLKDLFQDIKDLKEKIKDIEKDKLNNDDNYLVEEEYKKNVKILENNELIKSTHLKIKDLKNNIQIINTLFNKKIENQNEKVNIESINLQEIEKEKTNCKILICKKFDIMKEKKTFKYKKLLDNKKEIEEEIQSLKERKFFNKEKNLINRNNNILTIINFKKTQLELNKKNNDFLKEIEERKKNLENFKNYIYPLEKEQILLTLKNELTKNDKIFNDKLIDKETYFDNSKKINQLFDIKYDKLLGKINQLKINLKKIISEYQKFKIFKQIKYNNFNNKLHKSNNYFEKIKNNKIVLLDINKNLNEYNIISKNIEEIKKSELEKLDKRYQKELEIQNDKCICILSELEKIKKDNFDKVNNIDEEILKLEKKIDYLKFTNKNSNLNYELNVETYLSQSELQNKNIKKFTNELKSKENLYNYKMNLVENLQDIYNNNKLKKEIENNKLLIEELFEIQEIKKKLDEL